MKRFFSSRGRRHSVSFEATATPSSAQRGTKANSLDDEFQQNWCRNVLNELSVAEGQYVKALQTLNRYFLEPWNSLGEDLEVKSVCSIVRGMSAYHSRLEKTF